MRAERQNLIPLVEGYGDNEQGHLVLQVTDVLSEPGSWVPWTENKRNTRLQKKCVFRKTNPFFGKTPHIFFWPHNMVFFLKMLNL